MSPRVMLEIGRLPNMTFALVIETQIRFQEFGWLAYSPRGPDFERTSRATERLNLRPKF